MPSSSSASASDSPSTARSGSRRPRPALLAGLLGAVAIASGGLLALAPVDTADVRVTWPQDAAEIRSTSLLLTNQTPHVLDASFTSRAVEAAAATDDGVLLATIDPTEPEAATDGLVLTASGTALTLQASAGRPSRSRWTPAPTSPTRCTPTCRGSRSTPTGPASSTSRARCPRRSTPSSPAWARCPRRPTWPSACRWSTTSTAPPAGSRSPSWC
ncbi:hypothetical protein [Clavibacter zhangzhiyongii]|uniref:hypothetical protein n=1 Tax=Clavibacter zhangzhiyongii TaxID=2768071 RepID=UPI0039E0DCD6